VELKWQTKLCVKIITKEEIRAVDSTLSVCLCVMDLEPVYLIDLHGSLGPHKPNRLVICSAVLRKHCVLNAQTSDHAACDIGCSRPHLALAVGAGGAS